MLIFHKLPSRKHAESFACSVTQEEKLSASVYATQDESNAVDPFPYELLPPIVLVGRGDLTSRRHCRRSARLRGEVRGNLIPRSPLRLTPRVRGAFTFESGVCHQSSDSSAS